VTALTPVNVDGPYKVKIEAQALKIRIKKPGAISREKKKDFKNHGIVA
jgi:hypothetical protein